MWAYSFSNIIVVVNGVVIDSFAEGDDVVSVAPLADAASTKVGADGHMVASVSANRGCTVTLKLQQTSPGNSVLQNLFNTQVAQIAQFTPFTMSIKDAMKLDAVTATGGIITKEPTWVRGAVANDIEWELQFENHTVDQGIQSQLSSISANAVAAAGIPVAGLGI